MSTRIVLVEDDPNQARILRLYLEREEYSVVVATTGSRALAAFREQDAALVILDLMLPDLDGRDVCRLIRAESDVPILMLTARSAEGDVMPRTMHIRRRVIPPPVGLPWRAGKIRVLAAQKDARIDADPAWRIPPAGPGDDQLPLPLPGRRSGRSRGTLERVCAC